MTFWHRATLPIHRRPKFAQFLYFPGKTKGEYGTEGNRNGFVIACTKSDDDVPSRSTMRSADRLDQGHFPRWYHI
jgi:hypothetical protein